MDEHNNYKMVGTLGHELNNPLGIAVANLSLLEKTLPEEVKLQKAIAALDRITEIVKKIRNISQGKMEEIEYSSDSNIFKI